MVKAKRQTKPQPLHVRSSPRSGHHIGNSHRNQIIFGILISMALFETYRTLYPSAGADGAGGNGSLPVGLLVKSPAPVNAAQQHLLSVSNSNSNTHSATRAAQTQATIKAPPPPATTPPATTTKPPAATTTPPPLKTTPPVKTTTTPPPVKTTTAPPVITTTTTPPPVKPPPATVTITTTPTGPPLNPSDPHPIFTDSPVPIDKTKDRDIFLVHVGKSGGTTLRYQLALQCVLIFPINLTLRHRCFNKYRDDQKLSRQTLNVAHMWELNRTALAQSTSLLITLRNPVDRIVSTYKYSHTSNCRPNLERKIFANWGCDILNIHKTNPNRILVFDKCFPSGAMEDFAQATLAPYRPNQHWIEHNYTKAEIQHCRTVARTLVQGTMNIGRMIPHFTCNFEFYAKHNLWPHPDKELFGVRAETEWQDMISLDQQIGGSGKFEGDMNHTHGSEHYYPSPLSTDAYRKLCCVLEREIQVYFTILARVQNIKADDKRQNDAALRKKCGVKEGVSWPSWRMQCRKKMESQEEIGY